MKRSSVIIMFIIAGIVAMSSCKKDSDIFIPDPVLTQGPDTSWFNALPDSAPAKRLLASIAPVVYTDSFEVNNSPATITSPAGLTCLFPPLCCVTPNGLPITGKVYVQMLLIRKKGDMVAADKPTISNGRLLVSSGEIFVKLTRNGDELKLAPGKSIVLKYNDPQPIPGMQLFYGEESNPDRFNWIVGDSIGSGGTQTVTVGNNFYQLVSSRLRWINCDAFVNTTGTNPVQVAASLSPIYTNANSVCYLVFNNRQSVLGMYGNAVTKKFQTGLVPVGEPVTMVVISKLADQYFIGKQAFTTGQNITAVNQQIISITPLQTTLPDIKAYLDTL
jgi:hypothetical protein